MVIVKSVLYVALNAGNCWHNCGALSSGAEQVVGNTPTAIASADLNGDGVPDLVTANESSNNVSVSLGVGDGTFAASQSYTVGSDPSGVVASDLNHDGKADLVVANSGSNDISVLLANGDGTFQSDATFDGGTSPRSIAAADFNHDGAMDLAVADAGSNNVAVLLGTGDGTFASPSPYGVGTAPDFVAIGDFDRDGNVDLVTANAGSNSVSVLFGNADGTFQTAATYATGSAPASIDVRDVNRDGRLDLVIANKTSNSISVLLGKDDGTFENALNYDAGTGCRSVTTADINMDGRLDATVANHDSNDISIVYAATPNQTFAAGTGPTAIIAGDLNRDGKPDLAITNGDSSNVTVLLNDCPVPDLTIALSHNAPLSQGDTGRTYSIMVSNSGRAATTGYISVADTLPVGLSPTNMTGSGWICEYASAICHRTDSLAAGGSYPDITLTVNVANTAPLTIDNIVNVAGGEEIDTSNNTAIDTATVATVTDLVITSTHVDTFTQGDIGKTYSLTVRNAGGVTTNGTVSVTDTLPTGIAATAMSGVGWSCDLPSLTCARTDALGGGLRYPAITVIVNVASDAAPHVSNTVVVSGGGNVITTNDSYVDATTVWKRDTCGTFGSVYSEIETPVGNRLFVGHSDLLTPDVNNDGVPDLVTFASDVRVALVSADGSLSTVNSYPVSTSPYSIAAGDFNNDGIVDLAVGSAAGESVRLTSVAVLIGNGDGTFRAPINNYASEYNEVRHLDIADFDRDGNLDILEETVGFAVLLIRGRGNGTFDSPRSLSTSSFSVNIADLNGDGFPDLICRISGGFSVLLNDGTGSFPTHSDHMSGDYTSLVTGDFDADGKLDIVLLGGTDREQLLKFRGRGDGTFENGAIQPGDGDTGLLLAQDFNGDGKLDLLLADFSSRVAVFFGNGDLTFGTAVIYPVAHELSEIAVDDFNRDGVADLALGTLISSGRAGLAIRLGTCLTTAPTNLTATATSVSHIDVSWNAIAHATHYDVLRSSNGQSFQFVTSVTDTSFGDDTVSADTTYIYRVRAADDSTKSPLSAPDIATTTLFSDDPAVGRATTIKAAHINELRNAVNEVRAAAGLQAATFTDDTLSGTRAKAVHIWELRRALDAARAAIGLGDLSYTDPYMLTTIKAAHINELRNGVK